MASLLSEEIDQVSRTYKANKAQNDTCDVADQNIRQSEFDFTISQQVDTLDAVC